MIDKDEQKVDYGFRERFNELMKSIFDYIRNLTLAGTVVVAGHYLSTHGNNQILPINNATFLTIIGWFLIALCVLQGIFEILAIVPRITKRRGYSDNTRAFVILCIYLPLVVSLILYLIRDQM